MDGFGINPRIVLSNMAKLTTFIAILFAHIILVFSTFARRTVIPSLPYVGQFCASHIYANLTNLPRHLCVHRCMTSPGKCAAISYNTQGRYCTMVSMACAFPEFNNDFVYMRFEHPECVNWIPHIGGENYPENTVVVDDVRFAGRVRQGENFLVGYIDTTQVPTGITARTLSGDIVTSEEYEVLVVDPACPLEWVYYDSQSHSSLPDGVVAGGYLYNRSVYVAQWSTTSTYFGYYDELTGYSYIHTFSLTYMNVLTVVSPA